MGMSRADNSDLSINNPKPDLYNINAHTKLGENSLMVTQVIIQKQNTDRQTYHSLTEGQMDRHTNVQCETIIPLHYRVVGYDMKLTLV